MKKITFIILFIAALFVSKAQNNSTPDFVWMNGSYFNINVGDSIEFNNTRVKLVKIENHYNCFQINTDTIWMKVSRRSLSKISNGIRIFVADNKHIKNLANDINIHGLLTKDALICLTDFSEAYVDQNIYTFPVSFNDGFIWHAGEDSHMFTYLGTGYSDNPEFSGNHPGIDIDLSDARGLEKHLIVAMENCKVAWVEDRNLDEFDKEACILLESDSQPGIYYLYEHLYNKNVFVRKGQKLFRGEPVGTAWGDNCWGHVHISVLKSDTIPSYEHRKANVLSFFPQLYELYFNRSYSLTQNYSKGRILFGLRREINGNQKNIEAFEEFSGKGWVFNSWNMADKTEWSANVLEGNARVAKTMFKNQKAECTNPTNYFDYQINVLNGVYRIRAKVGDVSEETNQKLEFEGVEAFNASLPAGQFKWTNERIVKVNDGHLTVRIYVDEAGRKIAGLSEIVFQQAY